MQEFSLEHYNNMIALPAYELAIHVRQYIDSYLKSKNNIAKDIIDIINSVADGSIDEKIDQWS